MPHILRYDLRIGGVWILYGQRGCSSFQLLDYAEKRERESEYRPRLTSRAAGVTCGP